MAHRKDFMAHYKKTRIFLAGNKLKLQFSCLGSKMDFFTLIYQGRTGYCVKKEEETIIYLIIYLFIYLKKKVGKKPET